MATIALREAKVEADLARVETVLDAADLPTADVRRASVRVFLAAHDGTVVGVGGFERVGADGLLRSVAVREEHRHEGYGTAICAAVEDIAADAGVERLFLLTTDAAGFFAELGYERRDRTTVPESIRETREFADLCPTSATCMAKRVDRAAD